MAILPEDAGNNDRGPGSRVWSQEEADAWEEQAYWEAKEEHERREAAREETERRKSAVEEMTEWFHDQFEDPQIETPYDTEDDRYVYPWGGPFEAPDVLHSAFGHQYAEAWINEAVEEVEGGDIYEWAPKSGGDYYEQPDPEEHELEELTRPQLKARILERLDEVERRLDELPRNLGHNRPPDEVGVPPYSDEDEEELRAAIIISRDEVSSDSPDPQKLVDATRRLESIAQKVTAWVGKKLDLAVDETIKTSIRVGLPLWTFSQFYGSLEKLVDDLQQFILLLVGA